MYTYRLLPIVLLSFFSSLLFAAPAPKPKPEEDKPGSVEIDFSTLPAKGAKYGLRVIVKTTGTEYSQLMQLDENETPQSVRELFYESLKSSGHDVEYVGKYKLLVAGRKGLPITKCCALSDTLPKGAVPTVHPVKK